MRHGLAGFAVIAALSAPPAAQELPVNQTMYPRLIREVKPAYTPATRAEGIEGMVRLECVVQPDGTTANGRVLKSLHPELDQQALQALAEWRFAPGTKDGQPVPLRVEVEMSFNLQAGGTTYKGPALDAPEVLKPGNGVTTPTVVREVKASYMPEVMRAGVQGRVKLECVVLPDGTVGDIRVVEKMHPQQDAASVRALQQWTFKPGTKDNVAVPVRIEVEMTYTLGSRPRR